MRDGKEIIFTDHAKQRSNERNLGHWIDLLERFKKAIFLQNVFWKDENIIFVVKEQKNKYVVVTVYEPHPVEANPFTP